MINSTPRTGIKAKKYAGLLKMYEMGHEPAHWFDIGVNWYILCRKCAKICSVCKTGRKRASGAALTGFCKKRI